MRERNMLSYLYNIRNIPLQKWNNNDILYNTIWNILSSLYNILFKTEIIHTDILYTTIWNVFRKTTIYITIRKKTLVHFNWPQFSYHILENIMVEKFNNCSPFYLNYLRVGQYSFNIFINYLRSAIIRKSNFLLFADDLIIYTIIKGKHCTSELHHDINQRVTMVW